ncbi:MAG: YdcF family protein [Gammaproteobacteria bacterium]|nr:YdcF family protein [Gammaproteobacteria bacterium]MBT7236931.1 YdcF family protein [Gammaproteobacteria bacterium]
MFYINKLLLITGLATVLLLVITYYLFFEITNPEANNLDSHYDAIVILSGNPERAVVGSKLFFDKDADFIYLSKENKKIKNYIDPSNEKRVYETYINILLKNNISRGNIILFGTNNKSTYDEAKNFSNINLSGINKVLIVTNKFHIHRAKMIFNEFKQSVEIDFFYVDDTDNWSRDKQSIMMILSEIMKCFLFYIFDNFDGYLSHR